MVELNFVLDGPHDAPPVVLLNSLGADLSMWEEQVELLAHGHRIVRCDLRGHGASPVPSGPYLPEELAGDVIDLLDRLEIERATLVGVSLGGAMALSIAVDRPQRVERLAVCFSAAQFGPPQSWRERAAKVRADGIDAISDAVLERWFTESFAESRPQVLARMRAMLESTPAAGYAACCDALALLDLRDSLAAVTAPTLVMSGAEDPATPPVYGRRIAAAVAGAAFAELPGAAHLGNVETPDLFNALLLAHLQGL